MQQNKKILDTKILLDTIVPPHAGGLRADAFLASLLAKDAVSRSKIQQAILKGSLYLDGMPCTRPKNKLKQGQHLTFSLHRPETHLAPECGHLDIVYRDDHILVVNKPAGLTVHPAPGRPDGTLAHRLVHHFPELKSQAGLRPGIVHRLDKDTSGLLLVALTEQARLCLAESFAARTVHKEYLALLKGVPAADSGELNAPIGRHPTHKVRMAVTRNGRDARSSWRVLFSDASPCPWALAAVCIHTGRTHQIRVHMQHLGYPLWGDSLYHGMPSKHELALHPALKLTATRQMLHAWKLAFIHPITQKAMSFCQPPPDDFIALIRTLGSRSQRVVLTGLPACGKSALLRCLQDLGIAVWSADACVAALYAPGGDGWHLLRGRFGRRFVPYDSVPVDKQALLQAIKSSASLRHEVESLIHPVVCHHLEQFWQTHQDAPLAVAEVPLFVEAGWRNKADILVGIFSPTHIRHKRLRQTRGWHQETIAAMDAWQWSQPDKLRACHLVIDNSGTQKDLERHAHALTEVLASIRLRRLNALVYTAQSHMQAHT